MVIGHERGFVVLTAPRSGSTWLIDLLNGSTKARVQGELFIPHRKPRADRLMTPETAAYLDAHLRRFPLYCEIEEAWWRPRPWRTFAYLDRLFGGEGPIGFKLIYSNLVNLPEVWAYLMMRRLRVLHLVRLNHLDVYLSSRLRDSSGTVHALVGEPEAACSPIELDCADLLRALRRARRNIRLARLLLRLSGLPHREIHYEGLVEDRQVFATACEFLQLDVVDPQASSRLRKLVTRAHGELIRNYAEVRCALQATRFAPLLR